MKPLLADNYKSASRYFQISRQLNNNTANEAMSITMNHVINIQIIHTHFFVAEYYLPWVINIWY